LRIRRALKGLREAARRKRIFHLWFHPTNLADQTDAMFAGLRQILCRASELRSRGDLEILTMSQIVERCESTVRRAAEAVPAAMIGTGREPSCAE
jgi:hypothetical protein